MGIYTKTGDKGQTSLFDGQRVKKYSERVTAYGTLDECNTQISLAAKYTLKSQNRQYLTKVQHQLFLLAAEIATTDLSKIQEKSHLINNDDIAHLEKIIDEYTANLPVIKSFILPGTSLAGAQLHVARAVSRRAERKLVLLAQEVEIRNEALKYVNRLSDFLYILARSEDYYQRQQELVDRIMEVYVSRLPKKIGEGPIPYEILLKIQEAVMSMADSLNVPVTLAIVDQNGTLFYHYRMPNALLASVELAEKKAYSAVALKMKTVDLGKLVHETGELYQIETALSGKIVSFGGGCPLYHLGELIGGIGISGGSVEQDIKLVEYAQKCYQKEVSTCLKNN